VDPTGPREAQHRLPWREVGTGQVAARLPVPVEGSVRSTVSAVYRGIIATVRIPSSIESVSSGPLEAFVLDGAVVVTRRGSEAS
jgi:hypothetical protein